jgi:hypothetical protein
MRRLAVGMTAANQSLLFYGRDEFAVAIKRCRRIMAHCTSEA